MFVLCSNAKKIMDQIWYGYGYATFVWWIATLILSACGLAAYGLMQSVVAVIHTLEKVIAYFMTTYAPILYEFHVASISYTRGVDVYIMC